MQVLCDPILDECCLHTPYSMFCKDELMMVNWPKHDARGEIMKTHNVVFH